MRTERLSAEKLRAAADGDLVALVAAGNTAAFEELVGRHQRVVFSVARSAGLGREEVADVTQMVFLSLTDSAASIADGDRVRAWLCTIARRQSWRVLARRERVVLGEVPDQAVDSEAAARVDKAIDLMAGLDQLSERCRELLVALYLNDPPLEYAEVSAALDMPIGSIGPTRGRCIERLRELL